MHLSCSMLCWASACLAVPSGRKGGGTTQTMCPSHLKNIITTKVNSWRMNSPSTVHKPFTMHSHLLLNFQKHQNSSQNHAVASGNKTCSLVENIQVVVVEKHMQTTSKNVHKLHDENVHIQKAFQIHLHSRLHHVQMNFTKNILLVQKLLEITSPCINMHLYQTSTNSQCYHIILHHFQSPAQRNRQ